MTIADMERHRQQIIKLADMKERLIELEAGKDGVKSQNFKTSGSRSPKGYKEVEYLTDRIHKIDDLKQQIIELDSQIIDIKINVHRNIELVGNSFYRAILTYRYFSLMEWEEIATRLHRSRSYIKGQFKKAQTEVDTIHLLNSLV